MQVDRYLPHWVPGDLLVSFARLISHFERLWRSLIFGNRQMLAFKRVQKGDPGSNRPVSFTLTPGKSWSKSCWCTEQGWEKKVMKNSQCGITKNNSTACYDEMTESVDMERTVDVIYAGLVLKGRAVVMGETERLKESPDKKPYEIQWGQLSSPAPGNEEP